MEQQKIRDIEENLRKVNQGERVRCIYCNQPIHISRWGGINKNGLFCDNIICLTQLIRENEEAKSKDTSSTLSAPSETKSEPSNIHDKIKEQLK